MRIEQLQVENFRGFEAETFHFVPQFNLVVGDHGRGKTALLEALSIGLGSFFLGIPELPNQPLRSEDARVIPAEQGQAALGPVRVITTGMLAWRMLHWERRLDLQPEHGSQRQAQSIEAVAQQLATNVRAGEADPLPLLAYFASDRRFEAQRDQPPGRPAGPDSRLRGYTNCFEATAGFADFLRWVTEEARSVFQTKVPSVALNVVTQTLVDNLPGCQDLSYEWDSDQPQGLKVVLEDGRSLPWDRLSDGFRQMLGLLASLSYRCAWLNPHEGMAATLRTEGVVLIDELEQQLSPAWQRHLVAGLRRTFPRVQFIGTTHSLHLMQTTNFGELIHLQLGGYRASGGVGKSLETLAKEMQVGETPDEATG
jgi:predicted ATP-binding protein involved in virulence